MIPLAEFDLSTKKRNDEINNVHNIKYMHAYSNNNISLLKHIKYNNKLIVL